MIQKTLILISFLTLILNSNVIQNIFCHLFTYHNPCFLFILLWQFQSFMGEVAGGVYFIFFIYFLRVSNRPSSLKKAAYLRVLSHTSLTALNKSFVFCVLKSFYFFFFVPSSHASTDSNKNFECLVNDL